ncbi:MAG: hypothetical protein KDA79_19470, partial [Planctomycetaceae bacterium]|nr:hypothetical protein [Planctomycetaceae bacterium]
MQAHAIRRLPTALAAVLLSAGLFSSGYQSAPLQAAEATAEAAGASQPQLTFEADIRPLLKVHCLHCHGEAGEKEGGLDLRLKRLMLTGGDSGPAIEPGKP